MSIDFAKVLAKANENLKHRYSSRDGLTPTNSDEQILAALARINSTSCLFIMLGKLDVINPNFTPDIAGFMTRQENIRNSHNSKIAKTAILAVVLLIMLWVLSRS